MINKNNRTLKNYLILCGLALFGITSAVLAQARSNLSEQVLGLQQVQLQLQLFPQENSLAGRAALTWDNPQETLTFLLHGALQIAPNEDYTVEVVSQRGLAKIYRLQFRHAQTQTQISYKGKINEPIREGESPGIITDQGVSLLSESYWHPTFKEEAPWTIEVELPNGEWKVMMPGVMTRLEGNRFRFQSYLPTNEWALVADRFHIFEVTSSSGKLIQVWLKEDQLDLAQAYLDLVPGYIEDYAKILGPFPFAGYTVIENSLETGYAFPGFTLLGPSVIRLPFLLRSSLPHEILHSWWGNSVLVDYDRGNWCEGLTTYMADRAYAIKDGKGSEYRRASLQNFQDFVTKDRDFPLRRFVSRNDRGTQAVGYGKSMMTFQMLENYLGSSVFYGALSQFFKQNLWKPVGFAELQTSFENYTQQSLGHFFSPWLDQTGAPQVSITHVEYHPSEEQGSNKSSLSLRLKQTRASGDQAYLLPLRAKLMYSGGFVEQKLFILSQEEQSFEWALAPEAAGQTPQRLWIDPEFEVFRRLYAEETPFAMSQILVDKEIVTISLPAVDKESYRPWVDAVQGLYSQPLRVITELDPLPTTGPLWIIGSGNAHGQILSPSFKMRQISMVEGQMNYESKSWKLSESAVFAGESVQGHSVVWAWTDKNQPASVLVQKIKHYTSFSIVGFTHQKNDFKQTWPVLASPLIYNF